ncbi:MAG TPA: hypothetical protein VFP59_17855 [Candidatus Angelobacter sp.]|nr:hypothetical protein [Candidatus Angelobacter sp.]
MQQQQAAGASDESSISLNGTAQLKIDIFGTLAHGDRSGDERGDAHASQPKTECGCGAKQDKTSGKKEQDPPRGKRPVQKKPVQQKRSDASPAATQLKQGAAEPVTPKPVQRRGVLQAVWAYLDAEGGESLNLKSTSDPNVFELSRDGSKYVKAGTASDGRMIVKRQGGVHADWRYDSFTEYQNWTKGSQGVSVDAPLGSGKINAAHKRGAPKISSRQEDFGGAKLGDAYSDYISGLQSGGKTDVEIATALLKLDDTSLVSDIEKRAASMLHVTVYLAEEWRKQGAAKLYRAFLRSIENGEKTFKDFLTEYEFILSADEGRKQVARFTDVHRGVKSKSDLGPSEQIVYGNMSPLRDEDVESDSDMEVEKALSKTRDYSQKNKQPNIGWKDPW